MKSTWHSSEDCSIDILRSVSGTHNNNLTWWISHQACKTIKHSHHGFKLFIYDLKNQTLSPRYYYCYYFSGARSKGFATLRNVSKLQFFDKIGQAKSVAIWRSESRISSRYFEITSISLIYSLFFSRNKELLFWPSRGLNRLTCVTRQIRGDSKLRD